MKPLTNQNMSLKFNWAFVPNGGPMRTRLDHVTILTLDPHDTIHQDASITFDEHGILAINSPLDADVVIDGQHGLVMPGFINTHAHFAMIPFRSLQDDRPDRLRKFLLPLEQAAMNEKLAVAACRVAIAESLLAGVTTALDMYYFADAIANTFAQMGMRGVIAETIMREATCDASTPHGAMAMLPEFITKWKDHPLITPAIGPHGTTTVDLDVMTYCAQLSTQHSVPMTMHVSEMDYEMDYFRNQHHQTPIAYLDDHGLLTEHTILGHAIHTTAEDIERISRAKAKVAHCIGSNTKAAKGVAPVADLLKKGVAVGLGTDGPSSGNTLDLFIQMNLAAKFHKTALNDRSAFPAKTLIRLATQGGANVLGLGDRVGSLEIGKTADLILIETQSVNMFPMHDPYSVLVYSANPSNVDSVWVNGRNLVRNKQLVEHDVTALIEQLKLAMCDFNSEAQRISQQLD